ncbi:interleukin 17a/f2 [Plectropomus leopardus]|uniref:interleukin 17a/f2 n=1 Tax=Plectropomus leopardus TaxID=160734 RepID=UPI001C4AC003|nr:interleukin 17a/f2 [Plectropomus leopardus]
MKLSHSAYTLLAYCSVVWVVVSCSSEVKATPSSPPPGCNSKLAFSSKVSSFSEGNRDIHRRSLSPWSWRQSTVKDRIPSTIWEAECSNSFCISPHPEQTDGHNLNSVPIYQNVLVLNPQGGGGCYTASYHSVAVGCTCVWAKTEYKAPKPEPKSGNGHKKD